MSSDIASYLALPGGSHRCVWYARRAAALSCWCCDRRRSSVDWRFGGPVLVPTTRGQIGGLFMLRASMTERFILNSDLLHFWFILISFPSSGLRRQLAVNQSRNAPPEGQLEALSVRPLPQASGTPGGFTDPPLYSSLGSSWTKLHHAPHIGLIWSGSRVKSPLIA